MLVYINDSLENIKEALESLYNQSYKNNDIYIQEDGLVRKEVHDYLSNEYRNHKIFYLGTRDDSKGIAFSRNQILKVALKGKYEYFATMDSDDIAISNRILNQYKFMNENKEIDVCGCHIEEFSTLINYNKVVKYPLSHNAMFEFFRHRVPIANVTSFFRKSFFDKAGIYQTLGHINNEDTLMWMAGFQNGCKFANVDFIGVKVRISKDFFRRRGGRRKVWSDYKNRRHVKYVLGYGFSSEISALAMLIINILPPFCKKFLYRILR